ncbi:MAG: ADP-ribosylglycohydrolase family protein [Actinobacteria bacterium]|nr:ADP-ribosylglycohydrolase family protein [Actinomycetota bacterium]
MKAQTPTAGYREELRSRFRGALVGAAVGDALGAPFEGYPHPLGIGQFDDVATEPSALRYTDDTALTHALAESLIECGSLDLDHLAGRFAHTFNKDPHRGYGAGAARLLERVGAGEDWRTLAPNQFGDKGSFGNGAAMRVAPVALIAYPAVNRAVSMGRSSATVTHTHPEAVDAAGVQAAAVALAVAHLKPSSTASEVAATTGTGIKAVEAVPAALAAVLLNMTSFSATIQFAVNLGGDTDTIASMAGAVAGARLGEEAIPYSWTKLKEWKAGCLADRLWTKKYG